MEKFMFGIWTKSNEIEIFKIVANERYTVEIGELISVENLFWVNNATKRARNNIRRKIFGWTNVPEKMNSLYPVILET